MTKILRLTPKSSTIHDTRGTFFTTIDLLAEVKFPRTKLK